MSGLFPPHAQRLADVLATHGLPIPVDQAFLLGSPLNFFYLRGPHLVPPHQIAGLSATLVLAGLRRVGFQTAPLAAEALEGVLVQAPATGSLPWQIAPERVGRPSGPPVWLIATRPEAIGRAGEQLADPATQGWQALLPPAQPLAPLEALPRALADTAYAMMICSGAWQGIDGIEYFSEDLVRWELTPAWQESAASTAQTIAVSDGLWRRAYADALSHYEPAAVSAARWEALADEWALLGEELAEAARTGRAGGLGKLSRVVLRLAHQESRAWGWLIDTFGAGI
ncbi:MAG: BtrH N-terminal domain-containing protein [Ardenticatenaceae bacterium]|nr:BtrH N-terminal domain-containing protein [Ardenticatenaceae bacterium]